MLVLVTTIAEGASEDGAIATYQPISQQLCATMQQNSIHICRHKQDCFYSIAEGFSFCTRSNEILD